FSKIIERLELDASLTEEIEQKIIEVMESDAAPEDKLNAFKAIGEDSSAKILSAYLTKIGIEAAYVNPKDAGMILEKDSSGAKILDESFEKIYTLREKNGVLVIPGFFGYTKDGELATFSRGGSDITGAIIAAGVQA